MPHTSATISSISEAEWDVIKVLWDSGPLTAGQVVEALAVARRKGFRIAERPIRWVNDPNSKVSARAYLDVLREVVQVRRNMWKGIYESQA